MGLARSGWAAFLVSPVWFGSVVACGMTVRMTAALAIDPKPPPAEVATGSIVFDRDYGYERRTTMALATNSSSRGHDVPKPTTR